MSESVSQAVSELVLAGILTLGVYDCFSSKGSPVPLMVIVSLILPASLFLQLVKFKARRRRANTRAAAAAHERILQSRCVCLFVPGFT